MLAVTEMGGIVAPPVPAFYTRPQTIGDIVDQTVGRVLDLFDLESATFPRWGEEVLLSPRVAPAVQPARRLNGHAAAAAPRALA